MKRLASDLLGRAVRPRRDLLEVEWIAILLATVIVCVAAFTLDAVI